MSVDTKTFVGMLDGNGSITGGSIMYDGKDLAKFKKAKEWMTIRGKKIAMVMQDPMASLNERAKVDYIVSEGLLNFHMYKDCLLYTSYSV